MPKILEKTAEERGLGDRFQRSVAIAQQMVGCHHVSEDGEFYIISIYNGKITVHCPFNSVRVKDPDQFDLAYDLASRYEQAFNIEYKIRSKH